MLADATDGHGTEKCCEHCARMRQLFNELNEVLDGLVRRIRNLEDRR